MKYNPKFNIGQTVHIVEKDRSFIIKNIIVSFDDTNNEVHYLYGSDCNGRMYSEHDISTEKYKSKNIHDIVLSDKYYVPGDTGNVYCSIYNDDEFDNARISQGSAFLTKQEADAELEKRRIHELLKRLSNYYKYDTKKDNYYLARNTMPIAIRKANIIVANSNSAYVPGVVYFGSYKDAQRAIQSIGEKTLLESYFVMTDCRTTEQETIILNGQACLSKDQEIPLE